MVLLERFDVGFLLVREREKHMGTRELAIVNTDRTHITSEKRHKVHHSTLDISSKQNFGYGTISAVFWRPNAVI